MKTRVPLLAVAALAMLGLAGCSPSSSPPAGEGTAEESPAPGEPAESTPAEEPGEEPAGGSAALSVATTDLGDVVVDTDGRTLYMFDSDTQGGDTSACTGNCLEMWPPVITTETPTGAGISAEVGTIETPDGELQVTVNGWPVYTWYNDMAPGDVSGQGVGGIWWVLDPTGEPIRDMPESGGTGY